MQRSTTLSVILAAAGLLLAGPTFASTLYDVNLEPPASPTQAGWTAADATNINNVTFTALGESVTVDDRDRAANNGGGMESDMWRDFIFANGSFAEGEGMDVTVSGLLTDTPYYVTIWAYDTSSTPTRNATWTGSNGGTSGLLSFDGADPNPTTLNDYRLEITAVTDGSGVLTLEGRAGPNPSSSHNVFINGFEISDELPPILTVNRDTGGLVLSTDIPQQLLGYSITSDAGALDQDAWTTISGNYDVDGDESVDLDDTWVILTGADVDTDLSEAELGGPGPRDGGTLAAESSVVLSAGGAWLKYYDETDIEMTLLLDDGTQSRVPVSYVGNSDAPFDKGDLNFDGEIDAFDHAIFAAGLHTDLSALSIAKAYAMGDMNEDLASNAADFLLYRDIYDSVNGAGAFDSLAAGVPEPSAVTLLLVAGAVLVVRKRRCFCEKTGLWKLLLAGAIGLAGVTAASAETLQVQLSPTNADLQAGWTAILGDTLPLAATISGGEFDGLDIAATGTHTRSSNSDAAYLVVNHLDGDRDVLLSGGMLTNTSATDLTLTLTGLADGDYSIRTYHHTPYNRTDGFDFDMLLTDAVVTDNLIHDDVPVSFGTPITTPEIAYLEASFTVSGGSTTTLTFHPEAADFGTNGGDHLNLNGFELTAGELDPLVPIVPTLQVNTSTGQMTIANDMDVTFDLDYYEITSDSGSLDPDAWFSLDEQDIGFGTEAGESWTEAGGRSSRILSEFITLGSTPLAPTETLDLGFGFDAPGTQDVEFRYIAGDFLLSGTVEYVTDGFPLGDVNQDTEVNGLDVDPFVDVLLNGPFQLEADMNQDGEVNGLDVDPFVAAVVGGGAQQIPEPSALLLCVIALGVVGVWRKWRG